METILHLVRSFLGLIVIETPRNKLSYARIVGDSIKLPNGWEERVENINIRVSRTQVKQKLNDIWVPAIPDSRWVNSDHITIYREIPSNYSWGVKGTGKWQVSTGGAEKDMFTLKLTYTKDGTKFPLYIIFEGASPKEGTTQRRGTVSYEIQHHLPDNNGIDYPPVKKCIIACAPKGNSNDDLTIDILKKVIFQVLESLRVREEEYLLMILRGIADIL